MNTLAIALSLILADTMRPGVAVRDEGVAKGQAATVNCTGSGVTCSVSGGVWTLNGSGGGGGSPGGVSGNLQVNNGAGGFGAYGGASCSAGQFPSLQSASGAWTCASPLAQDWSVITGKPATFPATTPVATATALASDPTACGAGAYVTDINASGVLTCSTPPGTYTLPAASTTLGGVKMAAACGAGNHVSSIGVAGELGCTADSGGSGAPTTAQYWVGAADAGLSAEKDLSGFTGLVLNTAGTPSSKAANTCTNQFARSDTASGVWTCASIVAADLPTVGVAKGGSGLTTVAADQVYVGTATDTFTAKSLPACANATTSKLLYDTATHAFSCGTDQTSAGGASVAGTITKTTATWASSAVANTIGIVGTGATPLTSPTYAAAAPFSFRCWGTMTRPSTVNQPRYGISTSGSVTTLTTQVRIGLAGTAPAFTEALQSTTAAATAGCAAGCTANVITGGAARAFVDTIEGAGVMNATGTLSLVMAPSAAAAHTAGIGFSCIWY